MENMTMTNRIASRAACAALVAAFACVAGAQEAGESSLDVTIRLLPENAVGPGELTRQIELPPAARPDRPAAPPGDAANEDNARANGSEVAGEARERGRAVGQEVAEQARENRENAGRPEDAGRPDDRGPPPGNPQGPPETPPGQDPDRAPPGQDPDRVPPGQDPDRIPPGQERK
jgi:hypothetical protein